MTPEIIKCLCELNINNHLQPGEFIEAWYGRLSDIAYNVAQNPNTPPETLAILAGDFDRGIRGRVARNHNIYSETLAILAGDSDRGIRWYVTQNPNSHPEILAILAKDSYQKLL